MKRIFTVLTATILGLATLKANAFAYQQTPASTQHLKKDGTADKRYKSSSVAANSHLKKDGKPDMRYKSNNANAGKNS